MTIRNLIEREVDIDAHIIFHGVTTNAVGKIIDTDGIPRFEFYLDSDNVFHVDAYYARENE
jgi:hypothetical protein